MIDNKLEGAENFILITHKNGLVDFTFGGFWPGRTMNKVGRLLWPRARKYHKRWRRNVQKEDEEQRIKEGEDERKDKKEEEAPLSDPFAEEASLTDELDDDAKAILATIRGTSDE